MAKGFWRSREHGSIKRLRVGAEAAEANLRLLLKDILRRRAMTKYCGCVGGRGQRHDAGSGGMDRQPSCVSSASTRFEVVGDQVIALDAAFKGGPGILQIAGTGTNCIGRAPDGSRETAGGWSSRLGD